MLPVNVITSLAIRQERKKRAGRGRIIPRLLILSFPTSSSAAKCITPSLTQQLQAIGYDNTGRVLQPQRQGEILQDA